MSRLNTSPFQIRKFVCKMPSEVVFSSAETTIASRSKNQITTMKNSNKNQNSESKANDVAKKGFHEESKDFNQKPKSKLSEYIPLAVALLTIGAGAFTWSRNENSKRIYEEYHRKEERYIKLVESLTGFYEATDDSEQRKEFLNQLNLCWLYCSDEVVRKAYNFVDLSKPGRNVSREEQQRRLGEFILEIRKDLLKKEKLEMTNLKPEEFQMLYSKPTIKVKESGK